MKTTAKTYLITTRKSIAAVTDPAQLAGIVTQIDGLLHGPGRIVFTDDQAAKLAGLRARAERKLAVA